MLRPSRQRLVVFAFVSAALIAACSDGGTPPTPVPTSVELNKTSSTLDAIGATDQLTATVKDQNGATMSATVAWTVSGTAATVSGTGLVTAEANGSATVTATAGTATRSATITVQQVAAQMQKLPDGDGQQDTVTKTLPTQLTVQVNDRLSVAIVGAAVNFAVSAGGGSVNPATGSTGADGRLSTSWTFGTLAGNHTVTATPATGTGSAQFAGTAVADAPDTLFKVSGDSVQGQPGGALANPLVVKVADQHGNGVAGVDVTFTPTQGSANPTDATTDAQGLASTAWTLGGTEGGQSLVAASSGLNGSPVTFSATATNLAVSVVSPDPIVEGAAATITGAGFDPTPGNNTVMIDGVAAAVTAASLTELTVTVPTYTDCRPARDVDIVVTVGAANSDPVSHALRPAALVNLATGEQQIIRDPAGFCLQFDAAVANEAYLIGLQSTGEVPSNLTITRLISATPSGAPPAQPAPAAVVARAAGRTWQPSAQAERFAAHRLAERDVRRFDASFLRTAPPAAAPFGAAAAAAGFVDSTVNVGDSLFTLRVQTGSSCNTRDSIAVVVRAKGSRSIWVEDIANPANGYTLADFDSLSKWMDNVIFDTDTSYFGDPGDRDENGRVVIVVTKEVNLRSNSLLGFVISCDFYPRQEGSTGASNDGEFFYAKAPDPTATTPYTRADAFADAPFLIGHEFSHIIQFGRRIPSGGAYTPWMFEGQATLAEEVVGHAATGRSPLQNYGYTVAFNRGADSTDTDWYSDGFVDLALYFGFASQSSRFASAPHECTWVGDADDGNNGPCLPGREIYGVTWSLYRWASDQFGPTFPGGERGIHKAIIGNTLGGLDNLSAVLGVARDTLLAQWAASLFLDDAVGGLAARLRIPSWNFADIFASLNVNARPTPSDVSYAPFDLNRSVRDGSTAYFRISGASRPATAVRARTGTETVLSSTMRLWIVRLQ
jgi:hypothetical protein